MQTRRTARLLLASLIAASLAGCGAGPPVLRSHPSTPAAVAALGGGDVDAVMGDYPAVAYAARDDALSYVWPTKTCRGKHDRAIGRGDVLIGKTSSKRATNPAKAATHAVDATTWYATPSAEGSTPIRAAHSRS